MTDLTSFKDHFDPMKISAANVWEVTDYLLRECPVSHGADRNGDFWVANRYPDVLAILQDWNTFNNSKDAHIPPQAEGMEFPAMPPIDSNPPFHRHVRQLMNGHLSPQKVLEYEPAARQMIIELINDAADEARSKGHVDMVDKIFRPLPPLLTFRLLLGIEDDELDDVRRWVDDSYLEQQHTNVSESMMSFFLWLHSLVMRRKEGERQDDIIDMLLHGTPHADGGRLSDMEVMGAILILMFGGFLTTTDASATFLVRLVDDPGLQAVLRDRPALLSQAIEEHLRLNPPVAGLSRLCTREVEFGGRVIPEGSRIFWNITSANRDPDEFDRPNDFDLDRERNRHLAFGGGVHRCVGSHFARMTLRVLFEELLARSDAIAMADGQTVEWALSYGNVWYMPTAIPVSFPMIEEAC